MSENGWTDDHLCAEWFAKTFIPQANARNTSGKPILLIYDGHGSHDTAKLVELAVQHNIILFCLPPHTTHKLQPLDVGVFGPFSTAFLQRCDEIVDETGEEMPRENFVKEYMGVRRVTFKPSTIKKAWEKSGMWPINPDIFQDEDYAPSTTTSTTASHLPPSFLNDSNDCPCCLRDMDKDDDENDPNPSNDKDTESNAEDKDEHIEGLGPNQGCIINLEQESPPPMPPTSHMVHDQHQHHDTPVTIPTCQSKSVQPPRMPRRTRHCSSPARLHNHRCDEVQTLRLENQALISENARLRAQYALVVDAMQDMKRKQIIRDHKTVKKRKLNVDARCLTSEEGLRLVREQEAKREAREQEKRERHQQKQAKEAERQRQRDTKDPNEAFSGSLGSKSKDDLKDIASALGLSTDGPKKDLLSRINDKFTKTPALCTDTRYEGLFNRSRRRMQAVPDEENCSQSMAQTHAGPSTALSAAVPLTTDLINRPIQSQPAFNHPNLPFHHRFSGPLSYPTPHTQSPIPPYHPYYPLASFASRSLHDQPRHPS